MTTNDASDTDEFPGWVPTTTTHESTGRPTRLPESMGSKGAAEGAGSGETSTGDAVGDVGDAVDVTDDDDTDLIELAEWLDDEDDDDDADFERQSSAIDDLNRIIGHPMAGGQHKEQA
jgi:hypothetical protein